MTSRVCFISNGLSSFAVCNLFVGSKCRAAVRRSRPLVLSMPVEATTATATTTTTCGLHCCRCCCQTSCKRTDFNKIDDRLVLGALEGRRCCHRRRRRQDKTRGRNEFGRRVKRSGNWRAALEGRFKILNWTFGSSRESSLCLELDDSIERSARNNEIQEQPRRRAPPRRPRAAKF